MSSPRNPIHEPTTVDRQTTTPFLLKLFYHSGSFQPLSAFPVPTPSSPSPALPNHLQIYTWPTCTLLELSQLLTSTLPTLLPSPSIGTRLTFRFVFPDTRPPPPGGAGRLRDDDTRARYATKDLGSVIVAATPDDATNGDAVAFTETSEASRSLASFRFVIGDFVDVAVLPPLPDGSVAGVGMGGGTSRSYTARGGRENGHTGYGGGYAREGFARGRGGFRSDEYGDRVPPGEWRRGERLPDGSGGGRGYYGGPRGRGRGY